MSHVELPSALEDYFAHAELEGGEEGRRFTITMPYFNGQRLDRLQWWWSMTHAQLRVVGEPGLASARAAATARFRQHIEHWLAVNRFTLGGSDPIPRLNPSPALQGKAPPSPPAASHPPIILSARA
jgi:hypothetical protein